MNRLLFGSALGALAMYFLDPQQGRRRRARTRDKAVHAGRVLNDGGIQTPAAVDRAWKLAYGRLPSAEERKLSSTFLERHKPILEQRLARNENLTLPDNVPAGVSPVDAAAFVDLCHMLVNGNEFLYIN